MPEPRGKLTCFLLPAKHTSTSTANVAAHASAGKTSSGVTHVLWSLERGQKGQEQAGEQESLMPLC